MDGIGVGKPSTIETYQGSYSVLHCYRTLQRSFSVNPYAERPNDHCLIASALRIVGGLSGKK
jgi:hypothetical protein